MILFTGTTPTVQRTMLFDNLSINSVNRASSVHEYASGKSINAARVAHALGQPVLATGFLGGDGARIVRADLSASAIPHAFVEVDAPTRLCITAVDRAGGTATELIEESSAVAPAAYAELLERITQLAASAQMLVMSGTLPPGAPPDFYARAIAAASRARCIIDARGPALEAALTRRPFLVKPNRAELAETLDAEIDDEASLRGAMRELAARGARWVVVTDGTSPTFVTNGSRFWRIDVPRVRAISAIGSGDAMAGGIAVGLARGMDVPDACRLGSACAAANAMTPYAGHVDAGEVDRLRDAIVVNPA